MIFDKSEIVCFNSPPYYLSICAIFQDEAPYLREWIDYHRNMGVEHFWLYNNNSTDHYKEILKPYIDDHIVELFEWPSEVKDKHHYYYEVQCLAYDDALSKAKEKTEWLAIIDSDEFILPIQEKSIPMCLKKRFSDCAGICINWQTFGTSHIQKLEPKNGSYDILSHLIYKMRWDHEWNQNFKSIVKPRYVLKCPNPHFCFYLPGYYHLNTHLEYINMTSPIKTDILRINHYWTRDEWYFREKKIPRWTKKGIPIEEFLAHAEAMNEEKDETLKHLLGL